ncbi:MAG: hypothetical protein RIS75_250 [Actinomycetota bacterium]
MGNRMKRRASFIAAIAAAGMVLAACGGDSGAGDENTDGAFPTPNGGEVRLYNWTDYIDPELLKEFTEETGIKVVLDTFDSNETMLAKLQAGGTGYDVVVPSDYAVKQMIDLGLAIDIKVNTFPNAGNIKDNLVDVYWDPGRSYSAPYMYGTTGIAVNTKNADAAAIKSWKDFFAADDLTAVDVLKDQTEVVSAALRAVGVPTVDLCTTDKTKYAAAQKLLENFKPKIINSDGGIERMTKESSIVRMAWNGSAHRMTVEVPEIKYVYPAEGLNLWADNFVVPVGAPNVDNAKIFINWMMGAEAAAKASNFSGYDNGIKGSDAFMDESLKTDPAVVMSAEATALASPTPNCDLEARDLYTEVFTTWITSQG